MRESGRGPHSREGPGLVVGGLAAAATPDASRALHERVGAIASEEGRPRADHVSCEVDSSRPTSGPTSARGSPPWHRSRLPRRSRSHGRREAREVRPLAFAAPVLSTATRHLQRPHRRLRTQGPRPPRSTPRACSPTHACSREASRLLAVFSANAGPLRPVCSRGATGHRVVPLWSSGA